MKNISHCLFVLDFGMLISYNELGSNLEEELIRSSGANAVNQCLYPAMAPHFLFELLNCQQSAEFCVTALVAEN